MNVEIDGIDIAGALVGPYSDDLAAALIGCSFCPNASEIRGYVVTSATPADTKVTVERPTVAPALIEVAKGNIDPSDLVVEIMRAHRERLDAPYPADVKTVEAAGIMMALNRPDTAALSAVLRNTGLPSPMERFTAVSVTVRHDLNDLRKSLFRTWDDLSYEPMANHSIIKFAKYQRYDGLHEMALATLDRGIDSVTKSPDQHLIMLTQRVAVLLDLYEKSGDDEFLVGARKSYDFASALGIPSEYLMQVKERLERHEARRGSEGPQGSPR